MAAARGRFYLSREKCKYSTYALVGCNTFELMQEITRNFEMAFFRPKATPNQRAKFVILWGLSPLKKRKREAERDQSAQNQVKVTALREKRRTRTRRTINLHGEWHRAQESFVLGKQQITRIPSTHSTGLSSSFVTLNMHTDKIKVRTHTAIFGWCRGV